MIHFFQIIPFPEGLLLVLKGTNNFPFKSSTNSRFSLLKYALSPDNSSILKYSAVLFANSGNCGQSLSFSVVIFTDVTTLVLEPLMKWHLTHLLEQISFPCLKEYHL